MISQINKIVLQSDNVQSCLHGLYQAIVEKVRYFDEVNALITLTDGIGFIQVILYNVSFLYVLSHFCQLSLLTVALCAFRGHPHIRFQMSKIFNYIV